LSKLSTNVSNCDDDYDATTTKCLICKIASKKNVGLEEH
jgi:hypothetical protein